MNSDQIAQLENEAKLGEQAERLLQHPMLKSWFVARKAALFDSFAATGAKDDETRRLIWLKMQVVDELERDLQTHVNSGKMAKSTLKEFFDNLKNRRSRTRGTR